MIDGDDSRAASTDRIWCARQACAAVGRRDSAASCAALAPVGLGPPPEPVAGQDVGRDAAGKSVEDAALVTTTGSQGSAANSAAPLTRSRSGSRPGVAAPVAEKQ